MAKMTFLFVSVEGGDEGLRSVIQTAAAAIASRFGVEPAAPNGPQEPRAALSPAPPEAAELPAPEATGRWARDGAARGGDATEIRPIATAAEDAEVPAPRRPAPSRPAQRKPLNDAGLPKRYGRKIVIEGRDGQFTKAEAAELLGATVNAVAQACTPTGQRMGGRVKGKRVSFADGGPGEPAAPTVPTAMASLPSGYRPPSIESRPRYEGSATPINPNRVGAGAPVPQDPQRTHGTGWRPQTTEAV